jgi:uncharacterized membrane protein
VSRPVTILLGLVSVLPLAYVAYFISYMVSLRPGIQPQPMALESLLSLHLATMGLTVALTALYLVIAYRSSQVPNARRTFWAVVLFMGNVFAFPIFWYMFLWKQGPSGERAL